jgi:hypothetical protein
MRVYARNTGLFKVGLSFQSLLGHAHVADNSEGLKLPASGDVWEAEQVDSP